MVALVLPDALAGRAEDFRGTAREALIVSDFAAAEFSSVVGQRLRVGTFSREEARAALAGFDAWIGRAAYRCKVDPDDIALADTYLRRLDLTLLAPDAIHIAITRRVGAGLVTFDRRMAGAANNLGVAVAEA